jgi:cardiolipin hydrolase
MAPEEMQLLLVQSIEDLILSRGEKRALREIFEDLQLNDENLALLRRSIFDAARQKMTERNSQLVLNWLEDLMKMVQNHQSTTSRGPASESHFTPGDDCPRRIVQLIKNTRREIDICVFTITDDRLSEAIIQAHQRGVAIRILTDNEKAFDLGSDVPRFIEAQVPLKVDQTPFHMHHKFAIIDRQLLLTGSYNWTRGAAHDNHENFLLTSERPLVERFQDVFDRLWNQLPFPKPMPY